MSPFHIVVKGAKFYWRTHVGVLLGTALATMVLVGSLLVGDSVKATLKRQALARVGKVETAMTAGDRFFRADLAREVGGGTAPVLMMRGSLARTDGSARINAAQVLGVDDNFWKLAPENAEALSGEKVALNQRAADQLKIKVGDAVVLRVEKPGAFSRDAPLSGEESDVVAIRAEVSRIVGDNAFGRFSLAASQVPPASIYVPLSYLQQRLDFSSKANLLLGKSPSGVTAAAVASKWTLADAGLELRALPANTGWELRSSRVFLDPVEVAAAPRSGLEGLTYLVNELRAGDKATPYSMVTAVDAPSSGFLPAELDDDEIAITQWLADDLGVKLNDQISLKYYVMGERRQLEEQSRAFQIIHIIAMNDPALNTSWMPEFPGLSDQENCRDWKPGFAIDNTRIRDQDEAYWKQYRGTPKAFVNLTVGQQMWGNRWGNLTTIRYPASTTTEALAEQIRNKLSPAQIGFQFVPLREEALAATNTPVDFGELFVSFSFFLIVAAAVLTGLLFVFMLEQRTKEVGTLLALGLPGRMVRRMLLSEGAVLATIGAIIGSIGAVAYTVLVLRGLASVWRGAVGAVNFSLSASPASLIGGTLASVAIAVLAMWLASRKQLRNSAAELLSGESTWRVANRKGTGTLLRVSWIALLLAVLGSVVVLPKSPEAFFGVGSLLLIAGLLAAVDLLRLGASGAKFAAPTDLARRNAGRRRGRSLATIAVLASGVFMVVAVDSFRKGQEFDTTRRDTGTGGFALVGESTLPVYEDLNSPQGRETYAIDETTVADVSIVPLRVREGDDASCLNLNRALQPRLLAVRPSDLASRKAFSFSKAGASWEMLDAPGDDGSIPGIVDGNTLQWAMQKKLGDTIEYRDDRGQTFKVRLVGALSGSMLQGSVVISEKHFIERYPSAGGYRFFLVDAPKGKSEAINGELSRALQDRGLEMITASRRLGDFNAVENTYLSIFQALGGLGLLLGTAGLGIVVARNVLERRGEFGLLEALGFKAGQIRRLVFTEHRWLIVLGLVIGTGSALIAVFPQMIGRAGGFPWQEVAVLIAALALGCVFWVWLAMRLALRGSQIPALRNE